MDELIALKVWTEEKFKNDESQQKKLAKAVTDEVRQLLNEMKKDILESITKSVSLSRICSKCQAEENEDPSVQGLLEAKKYEDAFAKAQQENSMESWDHFFREAILPVNYFPEGNKWVLQPLRIFRQNLVANPGNVSDLLKEILMLVEEDFAKADQDFAEEKIELVRVVKEMLHEKEGKYNLPLDIKKTLTLIVKLCQV